MEAATKAFSIEKSDIIESADAQKREIIEIFEIEKRELHAGYDYQKNKMRNAFEEEKKELLARIEALSKQTPKKESGVQISQEFRRSSQRGSVLKKDQNSVNEPATQEISEGSRKNSSQSQRRESSRNKANDAQEVYQDTQAKRQSRLKDVQNKRESKDFGGEKNADAFEENQVPLAEMRASVAEKGGSAVEKRASVTEKRASAAETRGSVEEIRASAEEKRASVAEKRASVAEKRASVSEKRASVAEKRASVAEKRGSVAEKRASTNENVALIENELREDNETSEVPFVENGAALRESKEKLLNYEEKGYEQIAGESSAIYEGDNQNEEHKEENIEAQREGEIEKFEDFRETEDKGIKEADRDHNENRSSHQSIQNLVKTNMQNVYDSGCKYYDDQVEGYAQKNEEDQRRSGSFQKHDSKRNSQDYKNIQSNRESQILNKKKESVKGSYDATRVSHEYAAERASFDKQQRGSNSLANQKAESPENNALERKSNEFGSKEKPLNKSFDQKIKNSAEGFVNEEDAKNSMENLMMEGSIGGMGLGNNFVGSGEEKIRSNEEPSPKNLKEVVGPKGIDGNFKKGLVGQQTKEVNQNSVISSKESEHLHSANKENLPIVLFILGGPGSGKGTQCEKLVQHWGFSHFSTGDLLREEMKSGSDYAQMISSYTSEGKLVPSDLIVDLLKHNISKVASSDSSQKAPRGRKVILLDGFPRNQENLSCWNNKQMHEVCEEKFLIYFDCSLTTMESRILERGKTSGRLDDNPETIQKRLKTFENETKPIVEYFKSEGHLISVDAEGNVDEVFADLHKALVHHMQLPPVLENKASQNGVHKMNPEEDHEPGEGLVPSEEQNKVLPQILFVLGGPGSGKGTQCDKLKKKYNFLHFSSGDLLREEMKSGSEFAQLISQYTSQGQLVPSDLIVDLLRKSISEIKATSMPYSRPPIVLLDGFPRNKENFECWNSKKMQEICEEKFLLYFECSHESMKSRILERGKTSGRADDNPETIEKRLKTFESETRPIVEFFERRGNLISLNAEQGVNDVFLELVLALQEKGMVEESKPINYHFLSEENQEPNANALLENSEMVSEQIVLPIVIFILGGPGSGKGTQCDLMKRNFNFIHFSTGDLLRKEVNNGSEFSEMIRMFTNEGALVPSDLIVDLLKKNINECKLAFAKSHNPPVILLDGFPRNKDNIESWDRKGVAEICEQRYLIYFECSTESMTERIIERGKTSGRSDDNPDTIRKRLKTFEAETKPILEEFEQRGGLVTINAERDVDAIFNDLRIFLQSVSLI